MKPYIVCLLVTALSLGCATSLRFGLGQNASESEVDFSISAAQLVEVLVALDNQGMLDFLNRDKRTTLVDPLPVNPMRVQQ